VENNFAFSTSIMSKYDLSHCPIQARYRVCSVSHSEWGSFSRSLQTNKQKLSRWLRTWQSLNWIISRDNWNELSTLQYLLRSNGISVTLIRYVEGALFELFKDKGLHQNFRTNFKELQTRYFWTIFVWIDDCPSYCFFLEHFSLGSSPKKKMFPTVLPFPRAKSDLWFRCSTFSTMIWFPESQETAWYK